MRRLSVGRVTTAGLAALALIGLMVLGAAGRLPGDEQRRDQAENTSLADENLPATPIRDAPSSSDQLLTAGAAPKIDIEGDEVSPALATYGIDGDGNLFEVHSPRTREPHLGSPVG